MNKECKTHKLTHEDFLKPDSNWEPIPVDRTDPKLQKATEALDATLEEIRKDNGYNANVPQEKALVIENLKEASEALKKTESLSYGYVKMKIIDTLDLVIRRFGGASLGLSAQAARAAIFEWLKGIGAQILHWIY